MGWIENQRQRAQFNSVGTGYATSAIGLMDNARELSGLLVKSFWVWNRGPAAFTGGSLEISPDGQNWIGYDGTTMQTLGSGVLQRILIQNDNAQFWRFRALTGSSTATCIVWWGF